MDNMTKLVYVALGILIVGLVFSTLDNIIFGPLRAQDANRQCMERGFSYYLDYFQYPLNPNAYGVRCAYASLERKDIEIKANGTIPIAVS